MNQSPAHLSRWASAYVLGVIALGAVVVTYSAIDLARHPPAPQWLILVALTVISGCARLHSFSGKISFSISDTFSIAAALLFGPSAGATVAALDGLVLSYQMAVTRRTADRVLFNIAAPAVSTWAAAQVFFFLAGDGPLIEGPWGALRLLGLLTIFGVVDFVLNTGTVARAVSFEQRRPAFPFWRDHFSGFWISYFAGVFGAMLLLVLARLNTLDIVVLIAPLPVLIYVTFRHAVGRTEDQLSHLGKLNKVYVAAIEALAQAIDAKDQVTHDHIRRVQDQAVRLARALNVNDEDEIEALKAAALLHDVGKLAIPEHILNKPGKLTPSEYEIMKRHAAIGADILSVIDFPYPLVPIVRHHHEHWDGTGYPDGLSGASIPIGARILSVVDCFDALTSDRPYRPRLEDREALQILTDRRGTMYDPTVVDAFFALHQSESINTAAPVSVSVPAAGSLAAAPVREEDGHEALLLSFCHFGRALADASSPSSLGETIWSHLHPHLPAAAFVLFEYDDAVHGLRPAHEAGPIGIGPQALQMGLGERLSGWVAATGQPILNSDARLDLGDAASRNGPLRSALAVPVTTGKQVTAVLSFYATEVNAFTETHRRLVAAAARAVSLSGRDLKHAAR